MSRDDQTQLRRLRMEMLRMRAGVERAELVSAIRDVRGGAERLRSFSNIAGGIGAAVTGRSGWVGLIASLVRKPWAAAFALGAVRALKRKPMLAAVVVATAAALGVGLSRRQRGSASRVRTDEDYGAG
ncbi:hypothetical protein [Lysobacter brunescens]|uniref:DUF3618 domain-containing protein n=1 Tax=Lysobacter brunescens TaxID=262323 RepID=A0ABW2YIW6_9GAMM